MPLIYKKCKYNKALHADKIKLRSFLTTLYFAGELGRYAYEQGFA